MAQVLPAERDLRRVIGDAEGVGDREVDGLGEQELLELYRSMVLLRTYDERSVVYHRQGRIGTYAIFWNHEAMQAGAFHALEDEDWIFPSYRESAIGLLRGMPPATVLSWWRGHPAGWWNPEDYRVASICVPIGTHVPHAAGLAWGKKLKGERACAVVFFGDRATSEGAVHEGAYIDLERVEEETRRECVGRFEGYLRRAGILHDDLAASIRAGAADAMREAIAAAEAEPPASVELLFEHAYVDPPTSFGSDLDE